MPVAVNMANGEVEIYLDDGGAFTLPILDFKSIRKSFSEHKMLTDMTIRPTSVINYLNETNPYLLDAEINIETEKVRRKMTNAAYDMAKWAIPFAMVIIAGVIAWKMLMQGSGAGGADIVTSAASNMAPVVIK